MVLFDPLLSRLAYAESWTNTACDGFYSRASSLTMSLLMVPYALTYSMMQ